MTIYLDFDGTITKEDSIDTLLESHASSEWKTIEQLWLDGEISTDNCLKQQIRLLHINEYQLNEFIDSLEIQEGFTEFIEAAYSKCDIVIVSDGLDYIIHRVLKRALRVNLTVHANHLHVSNNHFEVLFPNADKKSCTEFLCKCRHFKIAHPCLFAGDGHTDFCFARKADTVFAKHKLKWYCEQNKIPHIPFENFWDIIDSKAFNLLLES